MPQPMTIKEKQQYARQLAASITPETPPERVREIEEEHAGLIAEIASHASSSHDLLSGHLRTYGVDPRNYDHLPPIARNAAMLDALADVSNRAGPVQGVVNLDPMTGLSRSESRRDNALGEALYVRLNPSHRPSEAARQFVGLTIPELARRSLNLAGHYSAGLSAAEAVTRGLHTTSDFPLILGDAVGRVLRAAYATAPSAIVSVARQSSAPDFRARRSLQLSSGPGLEKVSEAGEFKRGTFEEGGETYKLETFGRVFAISRQALVNDDLGAFTTVPQRLAQAAAALQAQSLADLVNSNPTMADGKSVFHADHKNIAASGAALSVDSLSEARLAMRSQKGLAGELISVTPKFLVVPPTLETTAEKLVATLTPVATSEVNPFAGKLTVVTEPRLVSPTAWYLAASPAEIAGLEYAYLEGSDGPQIDTRTGFDVDGVEIRVRLDWGAGWLDHRGWFKNAGD
jgi:hypothetical protein